MKLALLSTTHSMHVECADGVLPSRKGDYLTMPAPEEVGGGTMGVPAFQVLELALAGDTEYLDALGVKVVFLREHAPYDPASTEASHFFVPWTAPSRMPGTGTNDPSGAADAAP